MRTHILCFFFYAVIILISLHVQADVTRVVSSDSSYTSWCEIYGNITKVVDGDTMRVLVVVSNSSLTLTRGTVLTVRLADINAPELSSIEGVESKNQLISLIDRYGVEVCLDIDNLRVYDPYSRVIAVAYLRLNLTHWLNVNKWMVENGYASIVDYRDNEFDPATWSLYRTFHLTVSIEPSGRGDPLLPAVYLNPVTIMFSVALIALFLFLLAKMSGEMRLRYINQRD